MNDDDSAASSPAQAATSTAAAAASAAVTPPPSQQQRSTQNKRSRKAPFRWAEVQAAQMGASRADREEEDPDEAARRARAGKRAAKAAPAAAQPSIQIGYKFFKLFDDDEFYEGHVVAGPEDVFDVGTEELVPNWQVRYPSDGQHEDMTSEEILACPRQHPRLAVMNEKKARLAGTQSGYGKAMMSLLWFPNISEAEARAGLAHVGPPYGIQAALKYIHSQRDVNNNEDDYDGDDDNDEGEPTKKKKKFNVTMGMKVRKLIGGNQYLGAVTSDGVMKSCPDGTRVKMWQVTWEDDGEWEHLDWQELLRVRADRPTRMYPVRGRQLAMLELFCGCGIVSQEFADRKWKIRSLDNDDASNATDKVDIMKFQLGDIGYVPDFIWASPPCFTYSIMAGGKHRSVDAPEKTPEAREHNMYFAKMAHLLQTTKKLHPHAIFVIENPVGLLYKMPLMAELERTLGLHRVQVDYCAFGRCDKKPTHLWTNDFDLACALREYTCRNKCPYYGSTHPVGARGQGQYFNAAAIPEALAEEVAECVHSKFYRDRIRHSEAAPVPAQMGGDTATSTDECGASRAEETD